MHKALYRKWRPQVFDDVCGQDHITSVLKYEVSNQKVSHAYLFCGSRGVGKTTCAKILAKAVNCLSPINGNPCNCCEACRAIDNGIATDVVEMDAASNTSVDNVRDIKEEIVFLPSSLKYRVYIIDEVHMLSISAFNALLKTLEEPPEHVIFILATTETQKLPSTIVSRCQRYEFRRIDIDTLIRRLKFISKEENISLSDDAAKIIARSAQGGMRDSIGLLELCSSFDGEITEKVVNDILGIEGRSNIHDLIENILKKDFTSIYGTVQKLVRSSRDLGVFLRDMFDYYRDVLVCKSYNNYEKYLDLTKEESKDLFELAEKFSLNLLYYHISCVENAMQQITRNAECKVEFVEVCLTKMCSDELSQSVESLMLRMEKLEKEIGFLKANGVKPSMAEIDVQEKPKALSHEKATDEIKAMPNVPKTEKGTRTPIAEWSQIIDYASTTYPQFSHFIAQSNGFFESDKVILVVNNMLANNILSSSGNISFVREAIHHICEDKYPIQNIVVEYIPKKKQNTFEINYEG